MHGKKFLGKGTSVCISLLLIFLLFFNLIPITQSVNVFPGTPDEDSVYLGTTITFNNVRLTIRGDERMPIDQLNFRIMEGNSNVAFVKFNMDGSIVNQDPTGTFTVQRLFDISDLPYGYGGSYTAYDENEGTTQNYNYGYGNGGGFGYGYGYGYSDGGVDTNLNYRVKYTTHQVGTFYAKLFVTAESHTYKSSASSIFTVSTETEPSDVIYVDDDASSTWYDSTHVKTIQKALTGANDGANIIVKQGNYYGDIVIDKPVTLTGTGDEVTFVKKQGSEYAITVLSDDVEISDLNIEGVYLDNIKSSNIHDNNFSNADTGLYYIGSTDNTISANTFFNNGNGVVLLNSNNNVIKNSEFFNNANGITLTQSEQNILQSNYFSDNTNGIYTEMSSNNNLRQNTFENNLNGINTVNSNDLSISNNIFDSNTNGVYLRESHNNQVTNNMISNSLEKGIYLRYAKTNTIQTNYINYNKYGIYCFTSNKNWIFDNSFNNTNNVWDDNLNYWNSSYVTDGQNIIGGSFIAGNFWHDYPGKDTDGDGIGDSVVPYTSSGQITTGGDYHPLTYPNYNTAPNRPSRPLGPTSGTVDKQYTYSTETTDPDGDKIYYKWEYGDGLTTKWLGPYDSGDTCTQTFSWGSKGSYSIRVKSKDAHGEESVWSEPLVVSMPKGKGIDPFTNLGNFLQKFLSWFPSLESIIIFIYQVLVEILHI